MKDRTVNNIVPLYYNILHTHNHNKAKPQEGLPTHENIHIYLKQQNHFVWACKGSLLGCHKLAVKVLVDLCLGTHIRAHPLPPLGCWCRWEHYTFPQAFSYSSSDYLVSRSPHAKELKLKPPACSWGALPGSYHHALSQKKVHLSTCLWNSVCFELKKMNWKDTKTHHIAKQY